MRDDHRSRIAYVVFNDVYRDSRVLKTADSAARAGADVRVFAFGGPLSHFPAGSERRESGAEIVRLPLFPDNTPVLRSLIERRRVRLAAAMVAPAGAPSPPSSTGSQESQSARRSAQGPQALVRNVMRGAVRAATSVAFGIRDTDFRIRAARGISRWQPDIVHAHDANTLSVAMMVRKRTGAPFVYDAHELWEMRNAARSERARGRDRRLLDRGTRQMAGSITVSPSIQEWMTDRYALAKRPILVRNVPPRAAASPRREDGRLREMAGLTASDRVLIYVGRITTGRGIPETIEALRLLPADVHLVLLGYGPDAFLAELQRLIAAHGLEPRVHFVGSVESAEVPATIADADASIVYTQPINLSYRFSLPNKLFESIHAGQAIVASDLPDVERLVTQYGVGRTFPAGDPAALAKTVLEVLEAPEEYREASRAAARELTWEGEMTRLGQLYREVTGGRVSILDR